MPTETEPLGVCPECEAEIDPVQMLIEYEQEGGETGIFAECYACDKVVRPE